MQKISKIFRIFLSFPPILSYKNDMSGNPVWPKTSGFQKLVNLTNFRDFN